MMIPLADQRQQESVLGQYAAVRCCARPPASCPGTCNRPANKRTCTCAGTRACPDGHPAGRDVVERHTQDRQGRKLIVQVDSRAGALIAMRAGIPRTWASGAGRKSGPRANGAKISSAGSPAKPGSAGVYAIPSVNCRKIAWMTGGPAEQKTRYTRLLRMNLPGKKLPAGGFPLKCRDGRAAKAQAQAIATGPIIGHPKRQPRPRAQRGPAPRRSPSPAATDHFAAATRRSGARRAQRAPAPGSRPAKRRV